MFTLLRIFGGKYFPLYRYVYVASLDPSTTSSNPSVDPSHVEFGGRGDEYERSDWKHFSHHEQILHRVDDESLKQQQHDTFTYKMSTLSEESNISTVKPCPKLLGPR